MKSFLLSVLKFLLAPVAQYVESNLLLYAVVNTKSTLITNADAAPAVMAPAYQAHGRLREDIATVEVASGDSSGSTYRMVRVWSGWRISELIADTDDIGTTGAADVGLYDIAAAGGAVVDADFFASALVWNAGALANQNITHESGVVDLPNYGKRLWEQLGLASDPKKWYDIAATLTGAADAGGTFTLRARYVDGS